MNQQQSAFDEATQEAAHALLMWRIVWKHMRWAHG